MLEVNGGTFKSDRLRRLISVKSNTEEHNGILSKDGLLPDLEDAISEFEMLITWKKVAGSDD